MEKNLLKRLISEYQQIVTKVELTQRDICLSFPNALVWVSLGACLANSKMLECISKVKGLHYVGCFLFVVSFLMEYLEFVSGLGMFFMVVCLIVLFYNMHLKASAIFKRLRNYSILMFFWHFIAIGALNFVCKRVFGILPFDILDVYFFPLILVIVIPIASVILWAENKRGFGWLKYFH